MHWAAMTTPINIMQYNNSFYKIISSLLRSTIFNEIEIYSNFICFLPFFKSSVTWLLYYPNYPHVLIRDCLVFLTSIFIISIFAHFSKICCRKIDLSLILLYLHMTYTHFYFHFYRKLLIIYNFQNTFLEFFVYKLATMTNRRGQF